MVSDPAALAEDLSAETSKLDLGAVVDTLAKTTWGDQSISANTLGSRRAELSGLPREIVATPTGRLGHPGISVCSPRAPDQLGSVCNVGFSPSPDVGSTDTPDTRDLTARWKHPAPYIIARAESPEDKHTPSLRPAKCHRLQETRPAER